ncbi:response regulator [Saccharospirillum mangrovi]|uniref:response regulator n=1 Tax=Saccharospirillum mangrovi TaxID=2161747 RepID=UPI000D33244A|nr:response regulator [Saccharospirillum mangrovi]
MTAETKRTLVMVDDDPEDILLVKTAVRRADLPLEVVSIYDGDALFAYLEQGNFPTDVSPSTPPLIIFLDLNMPRLDGRKCLERLKNNPDWAELPILVFSTSEAPDDIRRCYELSANSYICKPDDPQALDKILSTVYRYWFGEVRSDV